jgi:hypothetical protein
MQDDARSGDRLAGGVEDHPAERMFLRRAKRQRGKAECDADGEDVDVSQKATPGIVTGLRLSLN